ncbi:Putative NIMA-interacting protein TinC [Aspergillus calidoustus]|uniref:Putative NIMA-interacting protein TinC n=1 Tax=Aspergillus calidoustus TaxID=454130 RepID=A0A0U5G807_ASPCI|nr:Putative NIMA-interacting protein TinC [Aspergillus calidoustus]
MGPSFSNLPLFLFVFFCFSSKVHAFGAGNIASLSKIEGQNWRHGDIEDVLLTLALARVAGGRKFSKLDVQRVYFGNWLRDYSQAVDVGTLKYVSAEAIRILLWVLGFLSFGYGTKEFEVTTERLGCYQPTEHIDNPLGYAEGEDARNYDRRLRGPVDEELELGIDPRTGLKNYIANEHVGIATSAGLVRQVFTRSVQLGRRYARSRNQEDLHEALRLLGTGLHCLEDYAAHSNYVELALIQLGETDVFPHVGRSTRVEIEGLREPVYPLVTGTFGGVDFFHSVLGEISDKATQSEIQGLEGVINQSQSDSPSDSFLQDLLSKIPDGLIGSSDEKVGRMDELKAESEHAKERTQGISPREPEEWANYLDDVQKQIYPVLEWHDELLKSINEAIEKIPVLPDLIEQVQEQITVAVFSILAPYILPILQQVKLELQTGSSEVIQSSREQQHIVFNDDYCTNPTHSMLSKDHFSNILNEPAGRIASQIVKWTVPQLMELWDDEDADIDATLDRIVFGVFHHPALYEYGRGGESEIRSIMFGTVQQWWSDKSRSEIDYLREQLSRNGVKEGKNHKEGVQDCGHGCGKPLTVHKDGGAYGQGRKPDVSGIEKIAAEAAGGGALGGLVGGLVSGVGSMLLNESGGGSRRTEEREYSYTQETREPQYERHYEQHQYTTRRSEDSGDEEKEKRRHRKHQKHHSRERDHSPKDDSEVSGDEEKRHRRRHQKHRSRERSHERSSGSDDEDKHRGYEYSQREGRHEDGGRRYVQETLEESYRPERGEYRSEYTQSTYESGNQSSYRHEQQEYHQESRSRQDYNSGYGESQTGYGGGEYSSGGYGTRNEYPSRGDYGSRDHQPRDETESRGYGQSQEGGYGGAYGSGGYGSRNEHRSRGDYGSREYEPRDEYESRRYGY